MEMKIVEEKSCKSHVDYVARTADWMSVERQNGMIAWRWGKAELSWESSEPTNKGENVNEFKE